MIIATMVKSISSVNYLDALIPWLLISGRIMSVMLLALTLPVDFSILLKNVRMLYNYTYITTY